VARLHEYQGKALLRAQGLAVPEGHAVSSAAEAREAARRLGGRVVLKAQVWVTGRAEKGGVLFADSPDLAAAHAEKLLALRFGSFAVTRILVERALEIDAELFVSLTIDDAAHAPVLLLDLHGGTGIEQRAAAVARLSTLVSSAAAAAMARASCGSGRPEYSLASRVAASRNACRSKSMRSERCVLTADYCSGISGDVPSSYAVFRGSWN